MNNFRDKILAADLIEVFKILRGFENLDPDRFFQVIGDGARRGHSFKLFKKRCRFDVGKFKFASWVCEEWNRLEDGIVSAGTVNVFKTRLDHERVFISICFFPCRWPSMTISLWMDPGMVLCER